MNVKQKKEFQAIVADEMTACPSDKWSDELDRIAVLLQDEHGLDSDEADEVVESEWWN